MGHFHDPDDQTPEQLPKCFEDRTDIFVEDLNYDLYQSFHWQPVESLTPNY